MMIVIMDAQATMKEKSAVIARAESLGFKIHLSDGKERTIIGIIGDKRDVDKEQIERMPGVERVVPVLKPFKVASREFKPEDTMFSIGEHTVGGKDLIISAGPMLSMRLISLAGATRALSHIDGSGFFSCSTRSASAMAVVMPTCDS